MAYQDHLTRQIEQLGMVLRRLITGLLGGGDPGGTALTPADAQAAIAEALELGPGALYRLTPEELVSALSARTACTEANMDLLAELLLAMAATDPDQAPVLHRQALALLERVNATSTTFSLERHAKLAQLRAMLP